MGGVGYKAARFRLAHSVMCLVHHRSWLQSRTFSPVETQPNAQCIIVVDCSAARLSPLTPSHVPDFPVVDVCPCGQPVARGS